MNTAIINTENKSDFKLITDLAKKIGVKIKILSHRQMEDIALGYLIEEGKTGGYINEEEFLKKLKDEN